MGNEKSHFQTPFLLYVGAAMNIPDEITGRNVRVPDELTGRNTGERPTLGAM